VNFPFICSNIPAAPAYGINISQMMQYSRACGCHDFLDRGLLLTYIITRKTSQREEGYSWYPIGIPTVLKNTSKIPKGL
jgi:hypothetical protein